MAAGPARGAICVQCEKIEITATALTVFVFFKILDQAVDNLSLNALDYFAAQRIFGALQCPVDAASALSGVSSLYLKPQGSSPGVFFCANSLC